MEKISIPTTFTFEKIKDTEDTRFTKVKIWLMHLGENRNKSYFSKEHVEAAIPSLANTPILGYIKTDDTGEEDFSDHRSIVVKEDGKVKVKYICNAYGLIPETNNAKFEMKRDSDGIEREYLTVEGELWNKWDDPIDIMERDSVKNQSMELHKDAEGFFDKKTKLFHFTNFKFFGACILGDDVKPAMSGSTVELAFSQTDFNEYILGQIEEFKLAFSQYQASNNDEDINKNKESDEMKDKLLKIALKFSLTEEQLTEKGIDLTTFSSEEDFEAKLTELTNFSLSSEQLVLEFRNQLRTKFTEKDDYGYKYKSYDYYYVDYIDGQVIAQSNVDGGRVVGFSYSLKGDKPVLDFESKKVKKILYADVDNGEDVSALFSVKESVDLVLELKEKEVEVKFSEKIQVKDTEIQEVSSNFETTKTELDEVKTKFQELVTEIEPLREFKANADKDLHEENMNALFTKFSQLEEEDIADLKEKMFELKLEDAEKELTYRLGKKAVEGNLNFSSKRNEDEELDNKNKSIKIKLDGNEFEVATSFEAQKSYAHLFDEYGTKK